MRDFPSYRQLDTMDCGPTCLRIIAAHYGRSWSLHTLRERCHISREGVSLLGISDAAEAVGFRTMGVKLTFRQLCDEAELPCIVGKNVDICLGPCFRAAPLHKRTVPQVVDINPGG